MSPVNMKLPFLSALIGAALLLATGANAEEAKKDAPKTETKSETKSDAAKDQKKSDAKADDKKAASKDEVAVISTSEGDMVIEFWPDVAPKTVENFKKLAKDGFYDGTAFHRVIKGFMIQGGDPLTKDASKEAMWGTGDPGYKIKAEFNDRSHKRGVISMARSANPDSAGSQFFICHGDPTFLDHQYTAFGKLIKGDDVLEKIATTPTHPPDRPDKRMEVKSVKIVPASDVK